MFRVLIVDDSQLVIRVLTAGLEGAGFQVAGAGRDGNEGLALFRSLRPDLVLLDITMPNKDGRECLEGILSEDPNARVVMVSAVKDEEVVASCTRQGARGFVQKPINFADEKQRGRFFRTVEKAMDGG